MLQQNFPWPQLPQQRILRQVSYEPEITAGCCSCYPTCFNKIMQWKCVYLIKLDINNKLYFIQNFVCKLKNCHYYIHYFDHSTVFFIPPIINYCRSWSISRHECTACVCTCGLKTKIFDLHIGKAWTGLESEEYSHLETISDGRLSEKHSNFHARSILWYAAYRTKIFFHFNIQSVTTDCINIALL